MSDSVNPDKFTYKRGDINVLHTPKEHPESLIPTNEEQQKALDAYIKNMDVYGLKSKKSLPKKQK